jgi:hypothetical protein
MWKYLIAERSCSLGEVVEALEGDYLKRYIEEYDGFYFLRGRKDLAERRIQSDKDSAVKFEIAEKVSRWLRFVPFVRMIAITGTLAMKNCEKSSDVDFFVALEKGRIFTGRFLVTATVHFMGKRRHGKKTRNRICLNYFTTTENLEIHRKDLFAANEYSFVYPVFGYDIFQKFCKSNFGWIKKIKPNWEIPDIVPARYFVDVRRLQRKVQRFPESLINSLFGDRIESWMRKKQIARIERNPLTKKKGAYVEYDNQNLIFLPEPQGVRVEEEWRRRIRTLTP